MRVLDYGELDELMEKYGELRAIYPLPHESVTEPALVLTPHKDARPAGCLGGAIANKEELG